MNQNSYGGTLEFKISDSFGIEAGQRKFNPMTRNGNPSYYYAGILLIIICVSYGMNEEIKVLRRNIQALYR